MVIGGDERTGEVSATFNAQQVEFVLNECGVEIVSDTDYGFLCYCPYHGNKNTPAFSISAISGYFNCFNQACNVQGELVDLIKATTKKNTYQALRLIAKAAVASKGDLTGRIAKILDRAELPEFPQATLDRLYRNFWDYPLAQEYMKSRGFHVGTVEDFKIGYSVKNDMITVPMHDVNGRPIGTIGRSVTGKDFKNSTGLPKNKSLYNIHRAKRTGDTVIVVEASFDVMKNTQAGYPNTVGCLGGNFSAYHQEQLDRYFSHIIIMTDFDDKEKHKYIGCKKCKLAGEESCIGHNPGRELGEKIASSMTGKKISWAVYNEKLVYPVGCKDTTDMSEKDIKTCIQGAVTNYEYQVWGYPK